MPVPRAARTVDLPHEEARRLIRRAVDKAEDIAMRGAVAVIGASGALVSASRMDHGGAGGMARARSKAWIAATQQIRSTEHLQRLGHIAPPMVTGFSAVSPEAVFPGAGGMPIRDGEWVVAGLAASGAGIGPFLDYPGAQREKLIAAGRPANGEDLLVHYALAIPYQGQHGDDDERWRAAYGELPGEPGLGMADPPPASRQHELDWALGLADRVLAEGAARSERIAVVIVDSRGEAIQLDRSDGAPAAAVNVAEATAAAAATFACPSEELVARFGGTEHVAIVAATLPYRIVAVPGGLPIHEDGELVGAIGVAGPVPATAREIAASCL